MQPSRWRRRFLTRVGIASCGGMITLGCLAWMGQGDHDLTVLCSNEGNVCQSLVSEFETRTGTTVEMVRLPTNEALTRLQLQRGAPEFDVWMGGPAEAYSLATDDHLLADISDMDFPHIDPRFKDDTWVGIYGGVLGLCVHDSLENPPESWEELGDTAASVVMPLPLSSGTAATFLAVQDERLGDDILPYLQQLDDRVVTYTESGTYPAQLVGQQWADVAITFLPYCEDQRAQGKPVHSVIPREGTGYEVGAAGLTKGTDNDYARDFLRFIASDEGQELAGGVRGQLPVTTTTSRSLIHELENVTAVFGADIDHVALRREYLISMWRDELYS